MCRNKKLKNFCPDIRNKSSWRIEAHEGLMISSIHLMITRDTSIRVLEFKNHYFGYPKKLKRGKQAHTIFSGSFSFLNTSKNWKRDRNLSEKWYLLPTATEIDSLEQHHRISSYCHWTFSVRLNQQHYRPTSSERSLIHFVDVSSLDI
jgi:hypothetical protein